MPGEAPCCLSLWRWVGLVWRQVAPWLHGSVAPWLGANSPHRGRVFGGKTLKHCVVSPQHLKPPPRSSLASPRAFGSCSSPGQSTSQVVPWMYERMTCHPQFPRCCLCPHPLWPGQQQRVEESLGLPHRLAILSSWARDEELTLGPSLGLWVG